MGENVDLSSICDLEEKLISARHSLTTLNDNIRRFVGRGLKDSRTEKYNTEIGSKRMEQNPDRNIQRHDGLKHKRRIHESKMVINRLSKGEEDAIWLPTPKINSRVIRELPSREEIVEAQGMDSESRARNRRMFGSLLGTLQKFCQEESRLKKNEDKKAQIEKKLEKQELQERELLQKERDALFLDRKRKQLEIRGLEKKMARVKDFKTWEHSIKYQKNQLRTKTKPHIFFRPKVHTAHTQKLILKHKSELDCLIKQRQEDLQAELREIEFTNNLDEDCTLEDSNMFDTSTDNKELHVETLLPEICEKIAKENYRKILRHQEA
ncbi:pinin [Drosophila innubila]|uniref:pinin n=1 Tax=Drosophila innubila TaxID=198719 RepID=UPI00148D3C70|nr:pinin [Drosophila innubila]